MPTLHIFRGLPGSGKTTAARKLAEETGAILIEPDALMVEDEVYRYTPERYVEAKKTALMLVALASRQGCDIIFADVLPRKIDVFTVVNATVFSGIYYREITHALKITPEESKARNTHNVKPEDIDRMAREWGIGNERLGICFRMRFRVRFDVGDMLHIEGVVA